MTFRTGQQVRIKPLSDKVGRIVGSQLVSRAKEVLYLVRYEVGNNVKEMHSESSLYTERELARA